jgi:acyl carrier protein
MEDRLKCVVQHWESVLGYADAAEDDNFFEHGGTSLRALVFTSLISRELEVELSPEDLKDAPALGQITALVRKKLTSGHDSKD